ncbi:hypothetical protein DHD08_01895 [Arenibacter sp. H213]|uniref:Uncharacterized protein n=1 Tax=Arenibacter antarcticus TaxID=2040469 RepID=A0ABW5VEP7_9FLAO|nr:hypothetical protein [Arenibacter sp. H213]MCM4166428.1 hypothetical protein [Arenibacter sp. H213]
MFHLGLFPVLSFGQQVKDVPEAFKALSSNPEIISVRNKINVPSKRGHFQGAQVIQHNGTEKLLVSGSSFSQAYILQIDLTTMETDTLIPLMKTPYRHAGGFQVSNGYLAVGIEDNFIKTSSKVCLYNFSNNNLYNTQPTITVDRHGKPEQQTAGAVGLLALDNQYLMVVANWDSRNWDFYHIDPKNKVQKKLGSFSALLNWASYQSINLIRDEEAIYAIGFYNGDDNVGYADLILVSETESFFPIMDKMLTKSFNGKKKVDFGTATGLQVDEEGNLHIWAIQSYPLKEMVINKFSQQL